MPTSGGCARRPAGPRSPTTSADMATRRTRWAPGRWPTWAGWRASSVGPTESTRADLRSRLEHGRLHGDSRGRDLGVDQRGDRDLSRGEEHLLRGLRSGDLEIRAGPEARSALEAWLGEHDLRDAAQLMGASRCCSSTRAETSAFPASGHRSSTSAQPSRASSSCCPAGITGSAQHDAELQGVALRWLGRALGYLRRLQPPPSRVSTRPSGPSSPLVALLTALPTWLSACCCPAAACRRCSACRSRSGRPGR